MTIIGREVWLRGCTMLAVWLLLATVCSAADAPRKTPNVLLIITDDQGYGDLACHGNPIVQTPSLDALYRQSVRLTNFHSDPTCAETRAALMTGRYSCRTGVWHTIEGRSILRRDEITMPQLFLKAGYRTAHFGKWHLGDNYPYRPHDRGFETTLYHGGGGVSQTPDYWGNDYFDDTYFRNGEPEPQKGYCTDIWFQEATKFIDQSRQGEQPFFCYVATNAPHSPYNVDDKYRQAYAERGVPQPKASFYGMIQNIDENIGRLLGKLDEWKLSDNTIVIFMTDNGTAEGNVERGIGYNAGMRAQKGSQYDGGHRVPCFIRWPGKLTPGEDFSNLTAHFDLLPTLWEWCDLGREANRDNPRLPPAAWDGRSLGELLTHRKGISWPQRTIVVHSQRQTVPQKWHKTAVLTERMRLVDNRELYDIVDDTAQQNNLINQNPQAVREMRDFYDRWWEDVSKNFAVPADIVLGADAAKTVLLTCHDWHEPSGKAFPFSQQAIKRGVVNNGYWTVSAEQPGKYQVILRDRPPGIAHKLEAAKARVEILGQEIEVDVPEGGEEVVVPVTLAVGSGRLRATLLDKGGQGRGAYFVVVKKL